MDRRIAAGYIQDNFRPEDRLAIVLLNKQTGHVLQRVATAGKISDDRYQAWLRHQNAEKFEVYISMNTLKPEAKGRTKADIQEIRHIYLDLDDGGQTKLDALLAREDLPRPNWVLQSSPGKFQVAWKVAGFDADRAERVMRTLVESTGADPAATDISRVLRVPGFRNHKYGGLGHLVSAERVSEGVRHATDFPEPTLPSAIPSQSGFVRRPPRSGAISQSERDWAYAKRALRRGDPAEDVIRTIQEHRRCDKSDPDYYARRTVEKASAAILTERPASRAR
jgi:hypothetical protein